MEYMEAVREAGKLYREWVSGDGNVNLDRIQASIRQDLNWRKNKPEYAGVVREMRGQLVKLGKIKKVLKAGGYKQNPSVRTAPKSAIPAKPSPPGSGGRGILYTLSRSDKV